MSKIFFFLKKFFFPFLAGLILLSFLGTISSYFLLKYNSEQVKNVIEREMGNHIGYDVQIASIEPKWHISNPSITIKNFVIFNKNYEQSISAKHMEFDFSWLSIIKLSPILDRVLIDQPNIDIVRNTDDVISINGIKINSGNDNSKISNWILNQDDLIIKNAYVSWQDKKRGDDILVLNDVNVNYASSKVLSFFDRREFFIISNLGEDSINSLAIKGDINLDDINNLDAIDGEIEFNLKSFDLASLAPWIDYPYNINSGSGDLNSVFYLEDGSLKGMKGTIDFNNIGIKNNLNPIKINSLYTLFNLSFDELYTNVELDNTSLQFIDNNSLANLNISATLNKFDVLTSLDVTIDKANLGTITNFSSYYPEINKSFKNIFDDLSPSGIIKNVDLNWQKAPSFIEGLVLSMNTEKVNLNTFDNIPKIQNLSAEVNIERGNGSLVIDSNELIIEQSSFFREPLKLNQVNGTINWLDSDIEFINLEIINDDFVSNLNGIYSSSDLNGDRIDLTVKLPRVDISRLSSYYPKSIGEAGLRWLDTSLLKGTAQNTQIAISGNMRDFPFVDSTNTPDPSKGTFEVYSSIMDSSIEYGTDWPIVEDFDLAVEVMGSTITLKSNSGNIANNNFVAFEANIDDFTSDKPVLNAGLKTNSPLDKMILAINKSPIRKAMRGISDSMEGSGQGALDVSLDIPLSDPDAMIFKGEYIFKEASMKNSDIDLPLMTNINGSLLFNNNNVSLEKGNAKLFNQPLNFSLRNDAEKTIIYLNGLFDSDLTLQEFDSDWGEKIKGKTNWKAEYILAEDSADFSFESDLLGLSVKSFEFFNKDKDDPLPLRILSKKDDSSNNTIDFSYGEIINAKLKINQKSNIKKGYIGINIIPEMPSDGIYLKAFLTSFDSKNFDFLFNKTSSKEGENEDLFRINSIFDKAELNIDQLTVMGNNLTNANVLVVPSKKGLVINIDSKEVQGDIDWSQSDNKYNLFFSRLHLSRNKPDSVANSSIIEKDLTKKISNKDTNLSTINLKADSFKINEANYGEVSLEAHEDLDGYIFDTLVFKNDAFVINGNGYWKSESFPEKTFINFNWDIYDVEKTLHNIGYPNLIEDGEASIIGSVSWDDGPSDFEASDFYGNFTINTKKGTIKKIEPGVAGRLVGLISLQNLPKRLTLDFSDLFQEGLPYKKVQSPNITINKGKLFTQELNIKSPSADIRMSGMIDFVDETQDLSLLIEPKLSDTVTAGALVGGPLAAAAAFIAQKILDDPFNKIISSEYHVTGTWDDPQEKIMDTNVDNFIEDSIINPAGKALDGLGDVINDYIIEPAENLNN